MSCFLKQYLESAYERKYAIFVFGREAEIGSRVTLTGLEFTVVKDDFASDSQVLGLWGYTIPDWLVSHNVISSVIHYVYD